MEDGMLGQTLNNRYLIEERLGQGGMGSVYKAQDIALNQKVAIKMLPFQMSASVETEKRFEREFIALTNLSHPNIVAVYEYGTTGSIIYFVMEYLQGHDLRWIMRTKPKKESDFLLITDIFIQSCHALHYMHTRGIIHRDIKPQNLFLQKNGVIKLMDFGLAKLQGSSVQITQEGAVLGTATYMSPEQASGKTIDVRSDIYSLGAILYHVVCMEPPFSGMNPMDILKKHLYEKPQIASYLNPFLPTVFAEIIKKSMEKDPDNRYQSAEAFSQALQRAKRIFDDGDKTDIAHHQKILNRMRQLFKRT